MIGVFIMENNFKKQIADDIALIQSQFSYKR